MSEHTRIDDLKRRLDNDPASIAFAQLAEEYRRIGDCESAVRICEAGLARHPGYVSARVTLGRALLELGRLEDARAEFARVLETAPDNLVAVGKMAEIHQRNRQTGNRNAQSAPVAASPQVVYETSADDRVVAELEAWLDVIAERRAAQTGETPKAEPRTEREHELRTERREV